MSEVDLPAGSGAGRNAHTPSDRYPSRERAYSLHDLLATPRRAVALDVLASHGTITLNTLAEIVAETEYGPDYDSQERKRVYVGLYQSHLPRLDNADVITYHDENGLIEPGSRFGEVRAFQRRARGDLGRLTRAASRLDIAIGRLHRRLQGVF